MVFAISFFATPQNEYNAGCLPVRGIYNCHDADRIYDIFFLKLQFSQ